MQDIVESSVLESPKRAKGIPQKSVFVLLQEKIYSKKALSWSNNIW